MPEGNHFKFYKFSHIQLFGSCLGNVRILLPMFWSPLLYSLDVFMTCTVEQYSWLLHLLVSSLIPAFVQPAF